MRDNPTRDRQGQNWDRPEGTGQAGCGKTMLAREDFDGPRVWDNKSTPRRIAGRDRRDERDGRRSEVRSPKSEVRGLRNVEPRTSNFG